jgi:hypothetical protein
MPTETLGPIPTTLWDLGAFKSNLNPTPIILVADVTNGAGESRYSALRLPGVGTGYQVTAGKTLYITRFDFFPGWLSALFLSGTADAGQDQVAAPAGAKSETSRTDGVIVPWRKDFIAGDPWLTIYTIIKITTARYPALRSMAPSTTAIVHCLAHEE